MQLERHMQQQNRKYTCTHIPTCVLRKISIHVKLFFRKNTKKIEKEDKEKACAFTQFHMLSRQLLF